jgi:hypothetical protein
VGILRDLRRWRFWRRLLTNAFAAFGAFAAVVGLIDVFSPGALVGHRFVAVVGILFSIAFGVWRAWPRPVQAKFNSPQTTIRVVRGDIYSQDAHLVIGACDTFDTEAPYIAPGSVQGQFVGRAFGGDHSAFEAQLNSALVGAKTSGTIAKAGKTQRYEIGTVVTIRSLARRFFFVAYTKMDKDNKAHATADGLWKSLGGLWSAIRKESNGTAVAIPVVGGGQSGLSPVLPAEDAVRFIALSFIIASRKKKICDELRIVALPAQYDEFDHLELQAFLSALRRS